MFSELTTNEILLIPLCSWAVAQLIKLLVSLVREGRFDLRSLMAGGGMPSSHSAVVCALATVVAMIAGMGSVAFAICAVLAVVVMYDAAGVRRSVGRQAVVLNRILQEMRARRPIAALERDLRELIGHTPFQVFVGAAIGIAVAWLWVTISAL